MSKTAILQKIKALAEQGIYGEQENACNILKKLMTKYGITEQEIEQVNEQKYAFKVPNKYRDIFICLVAKVKDVVRVECEHYRTHIRILLTPVQYIEISYSFPIYCNAFDEEMQLFVKAFCSKHSLYSSNSVKRKWKDLTDEEKKEQERLRAISDALKTVHIHKQLQ